MKVKDRFNECHQPHVLGLRKFEDPRAAFWVMQGFWSDEKEYLAVDERYFVHQVLVLAIVALWACHSGEISKEECYAALGQCEQKSSYLLQFNFFLYNQKNNCFYTGLEDEDYYWDEDQFKIYDEVYDTYSFSRIVEHAKKKSNEYLSEKGKDATFKGHMDYCLEGCDDFLAGMLEYSFSLIRLTP